MNKLKFEQFAIGSFHYPRYPLCYFLDSVQRLEVKNIELWGVAPHLYVDDLTGADVKAIKREIDARGLRLICYCPEQNTYPFNISSTNKALRERSIAFMERSIVLGAQLGAPTFLLCPGTGFLNEDPGEAFKLLCDAAQRLLPTAHREGVTIVAETQTWHDCNILHTAADQRRLLDEVNDPAFKAMLDVSQMTIYGDTIADNLQILGDDIRHMHLTSSYSDSLDLTLQGDALRQKYPDGRPLSTHIGFRAGNNPIIDYLRQMGEGGYSHYISLEICARECFGDPEFYAREGLEMMKQAL
ncbi:sugar phosphate isomerase/epimerase family protein [Harryflintia acetispora]|uniref:Protein FrlC n=1 Tax=Harryflintia acetispora TaxID=1849041 RepID=A0A9X8Y7D8_9FIRM|nr:sugar phosphate isomerase/epimerase family protein [Harryflintia acetispora]TCL41847.1 protein FrlC [Harryflintia acetispora]